MVMATQVVAFHYNKYLALWPAFSIELLLAILGMGDIDILPHDYCHEQILRLSRLLST